MVVWGKIPTQGDQVKPQPLLTPTVKVHRVMVDNFVTDVVKHEDFVRAITNARTERDEAKDKEWSAKLAALPRSEPKEAGDVVKALEILKELHPLERVIPTRGQKKAWWAIGALEAYLSAPAKSAPEAEGGWQPIETAPKMPKDEYRNILLGGGDFKTKAVIGYGCMMTNDDDEDEWTFIWDEGVVHPTLWQEIPALPKPL